MPNVLPPFQNEIKKLPFSEILTDTQELSILDKRGGESLSFNNVQQGSSIQSHASGTSDTLMESVMPDITNNESDYAKINSQSNFSSIFDVIFDEQEKHTLYFCSSHVLSDLFLCSESLAFRYYKRATHLCFSLCTFTQVKL